MTREEAIDILEKYKTESEEDYYVKRAEALDMAIKALEQEPCEDAVSRQALYEALYERFHEEDSPNNITEVRLGAVRNFVKDFPSVTPTQKWNTTPPTENTYDILLSSETEDEEPHVWIGFYEDGHYYYADGILSVDDEIKAWMPLPNPYKAEMESEDGILDKSTQ